MEYNNDDITLEYIKDNFLLFISTTKEGVFRTFSDVLKGILTDFHFIIYDKMMKISQPNVENIERAKLYIYSEIYGDKLEMFHCDSKYTKDFPLELGLNSKELYVRLKTFKSNDTLTFLIEKNKPDIFKIIKRDKEADTTFTYTLKLKEFERFGSEHDISQTEFYFESGLTVSSIKFQKAIKEYYSLSGKERTDTIQLKKERDSLSFLGKMTQNTFECVISGNSDSSEDYYIDAGSDCCSIVGIDYEVDDNVEDIIRKTTDKIVKIHKQSNDNKEQLDSTDCSTGTFEVSYLLTISKATPLNEFMSLYLENDNVSDYSSDNESEADKPLVISYNINEIGRLIFLLDGI